MKKNKYLLAILTGLVMFFFQLCKTERIEPPNIAEEHKCEFSISGEVRDAKTDLGIPNCKILINGEEVITDHLGYYKFTRDEINWKGDPLIASSPGYISQSSKVSAKATEEICNANLSVGFYLSPLANTLIINDEPATISLADGVELIVPRGALDKTTTVRITSLNDNQLLGKYQSSTLPALSFVFEPEGLVLDKPLQLKFANNYSTEEPSLLRTFSLNNNSLQWEKDIEPAATLNTADNTISLDVKQFRPISTGFDSIVRDVVHTSMWITRGVDSVVIACCNCKAVCRKKVKHSLKPKTVKEGGGNLNLRKLCAATGHENVNSNPKIHTGQKWYVVGKCKTQLIYFNTLVKVTTGVVIATNLPFTITSWTDLRGPYVEPETNGCYLFPNSKCHQGCPD